MKVAFSTQGDGLDSPMDSRFGRAPKFLVFDTETRGFAVVDMRKCYCVKRWPTT